jgi:hypothetical protein
MTEQQRFPPRPGSASLQLSGPRVDFIHALHLDAAEPDHLSDLARAGKPSAAPRSHRAPAHSDVAPLRHDWPSTGTRARWPRHPGR